jgi:hypothetical protein
MSQFSLACVPGRGAKRSIATVPSASKIDIEQGPSPVRRQRMPEKAPVVVCMYKITDRASDLWSHFEEGDEAALFQVQIAHEARPSVCYDMVRTFNGFLAAGLQEGTMPKSARELESQCGIKLVITTTEDQDGIGTFVQWRVAFYVGGAATDALNNFLLLLDEFWAFKAKTLGHFDVHLHPHSGIDLAPVKDDLEFEHCTLEEPASELPLGVFQAHPVGAKRILTCHIQPQSDDTFDLLVSGYTWPFRQRFDQHGIAGSYHANDGDAKQEYYRVKKGIDISEGEQKESVLQMLGNKVLNNLAVRVVVDKKDDIDEDSDLHAFVEELRALPSCHFVS